MASASDSKNTVLSWDEFVTKCRQLKIKQDTPLIIKHESNRISLLKFTTLDVSNPFAIKLICSCVLNSDRFEYVNQERIEHDTVLRIKRIELVSKEVWDKVADQNFF